MNNSSILSSELDNTCLNESLLNENEVERSHVSVEKEEIFQEILINKELLSKYSDLFQETMKIFAERCSNEELRKLALQYQKICASVNQQKRQSKLQENQPNEHSQQDLQHLKIARIYQQLTNQIDTIMNERDQKTKKLIEISLERDSNRLKLNKLLDFVKSAMQNQERNPYESIDQEYKREIESVLKQHSAKPKLGLTSEEPGQQLLSEGQRQEAKRKRMRQQIAKLQAQLQSFKRMTQKEQKLTQSLKQNIQKSQQSQTEELKKINSSEDATLKRNILGDLIEVFINKHLKQQEFDHNLDKPVEEYLKEIEYINDKISLTKQELQQISFINAEKQNVCTLLEKKLNQLKKENKQHQLSLNKQRQITHEEINTKSMNNQVVVIKTYHFEGNKIQSEISQIQAKHKTKQVKIFLEQQSINHLECNQKVFVEKESLGWIEKILTFLHIKNCKNLLNIILFIWFLILCFYFSKAFLIHEEFIPNPQIVKAPRTVVHRYQGKNRIVDGQVVNISHSDRQPHDETQNVFDAKNNGEAYSIQQEVIVIQPVPEHPKKTWVDILKMEYK